MILDRGDGNKPTSNSSNTVLAARTIDACTNPNCKAKKRSTHTTANCYWPGGGKKGQFPPNFGQRAQVNIAGYTPLESTEHFVLSARVLTQNNGVVPAIFTQDDDVMPAILIGDEGDPDNAPTVLIEDGDDLVPNTAVGQVFSEMENGAIVSITASPKAFMSKVLTSFGSRGIPTFLDSGASNTMFVSQKVLRPLLYGLVIPQKL